MFAWYEWADMHAFYHHLQHLGAQAFEAIARSAHEACDSDQDQDA